jgi:hypothetical protein
MASTGCPVHRSTAIWSRVGTPNLTQKSLSDALLPDNASTPRHGFQNAADGTPVTPWDTPWWKPATWGHAEPLSWSLVPLSGNPRAAPSSVNVTIHLRLFFSLASRLQVFCERQGLSEQQDSLELVGARRCTSESPTRNDYYVTPTLPTTPTVSIRIVARMTAASLTPH